MTLDGQTFAQTVLGTVPASSLGKVYPHEHLAAHPPEEISTADPDLVLDDLAAVLPDIADFMRLGGGTIADLTTPDYGRDVLALAEISRRSGVNVIAATGYNKALYSERLLRGRSLEDLIREFTLEIVEGTDGTGIRCGVIKVGTSLNEIKPTEEIVLRAGARAHLATGCPIITHTERGTCALEQLDLFAMEGVPADSVMISHLDFTPDFDEVTRAARRGAFISFDHAPKPKYSIEDRDIERITRLAADGFGDQIVISGDFSRKSYYRAWGGGPGLGYLLGPFSEHLADTLTTTGLDASSLLDNFFRQNPQRALAFRTVGSSYVLDDQKETVG